MPLNQNLMNFESIVTKGEIAHNEQFHLLPQCFQLILIIKPSLNEFPHIDAFFYFLYNLIVFFHGKKVHLDFFFVVYGKRVKTTLEVIFNPS